MPSQLGLGIGLGLAMACDIVYAAASAKVGSPFARIGAVLDSGGHRYLVDRLVEAPEPEEEIIIPTRTDGSPTARSS